MTASTATPPGSLYVVATPIGNLEDITQRAINTLKQVDMILAEDTRHSQKLLTALGIKKSLQSLHAHNEETISQSIINQLNQGKSFALISDAGTPLISDPGYPLIKMARNMEIPVIPIPGPSALITALCAAGVPSDTFTFAGFLPAKTNARQQTLKTFSSLQHTLIFYESSHRILNCFDDLILVFGDKTPFVLAKELTKAFERFIYGCGEEIKSWLLENPAHQKGEFVIIIPPREQKENINDDDSLLLTLLEELPLKQAVKIACQLSDKNKNEIYKRALEIKK